MHLCTAIATLSTLAFFLFASAHEGRPPDLIKRRVYVCDRTKIISVTREITFGL